MAQKSQKILKFSLLSLTLTLALAANATSQEVTKSGTPDDKIGHFGADLSTTTSVGLNKEQPNSASVLEVTGRYFVTPTASLFLALSGGKEYTGKREFFFDDMQVGLSDSALYTFDLDAFDLKLRGSFSASLPTSKASQRLSQMTALVTSIGVGTLWRSFILGYDFIPAFYINRYTSATSGKPNKRFGFGNTFTLGYKFTEEFDLTTTWNFTFLSTYNQKVPKGTYNFTQSLGYAITPELSARAGASTKGNQLKHGGTKSNVELYSIDGTELFFSLGYSF